MKAWIIFNEDVDGPLAEAFEVRRFLAEGRAMGHEVEVYHPKQFDLVVNENNRDSVLIEGQYVSLPDVVIPRAYSVDNGYFFLAVLRHLERLGVTVYNNAICIETVADKLYTHQALVEHSLPTPATMLAKFPVDVDLVARKIGFPLVVKTLQGVNGTGVFLIEDQKHFQKLMDVLYEVTPDIQLIFQEFVENSHGRDLRLFVVDGDVVAAMERRSSDGGFKANITQGGIGVEIQPDQKAIEIAIKAASVLGIQIAGVDLLYRENGYTVCEANTFPGFKGLETYCDINIPNLVFKSIEKRLAEKANK